MAESRKDSVPLIGLLVENYLAKTMFDAHIRRSAGVGSQLGMSDRYNRQRIGLELVNSSSSSSSRISLWPGQGHSLCSICMPRDVPHVRLGGVRSTRLHASGTDDPQLLLYRCGVLATLSLTCLRDVRISRLRVIRIVSVLIRTHVHTHSYSRVSPSFALPDYRLL